MKDKLSFLALFHFIVAIRWLLFVTRYLWLEICDLLSESFYLKLTVTSKKLDPFAHCCVSCKFLQNGSSDQKSYLMKVDGSAKNPVGILGLPGSHIGFHRRFVFAALERVPPLPLGWYFSYKSSMPRKYMKWLQWPAK